MEPVVLVETDKEFLIVDWEHVSISIHTAVMSRLLTSMLLCIQRQTLLSCNIVSHMLCHATVQFTSLCSV